MPLPPLVTFPHDVLEVLLHGQRRQPEGARQQGLGGCSMKESLNVAL